MAEVEYQQGFIKQYIKIPPSISARIDAEYSAEDDGVKHCLCLIITNLLVYERVAYSRRKQFYVENGTQYYTYTKMLQAVDILIDKGYVISKKGFKGIGYERGVSSSLNILPRLRQEYPPINKVELDIIALPLLLWDGKPIFEGSTLPIQPPTPIYGTVCKLNRNYFNRMVIDFRNIKLPEEYLSIANLTREYKNKEVGRWYQLGGYSYQSLPEEQRKVLLLNEEVVTELDYSAMHPHLLYAWEGKQCPEGFYERIVAICGCSRYIAKDVTLKAINAHDYRGLVSSISFEKGKELKANRRRLVPKPILYDELKKQNISPRQVIDAFSEVHPVIAKYLFSGLANKLMFKESNIMTSVLLKLMKKDIPALPIHDSLVFPLRHKDTVKQIMEDEYQRHTHFKIGVS